MQHLLYPILKPSRTVQKLFKRRAQKVVRPNPHQLHQFQQPCEEAVSSLQLPSSHSASFHSRLLWSGMLCRTFAGQVVSLVLLSSFSMNSLTVLPCPLLLFSSFIFLYFEVNLFSLSHNIAFHLAGIPSPLFSLLSLKQDLILCTCSNCCWIWSSDHMVMRDSTSLSLQIWPLAVILTCN